MKQECNCYYKDQTTATFYGRIDTEKHFCTQKDTYEGPNASGESTVGKTIPKFIGPWKVMVVVGGLV